MKAQQKNRKELNLKASHSSLPIKQPYGLLGEAT